MTNANQQVEITAYLREWQAGDRDALDKLIPNVYQALRRIARRQRSGEAHAHAPETTEIVHHAYIELVDASVDWVDRAHFFAVAAQVMRRLLVDQARARYRQKRGGPELQLETLDEQSIGTEVDTQLLDLERALIKLGEHHGRKARTLECHFFAGMSYQEIAVALGISEATVERDLRFAKAFVYRVLKGESALPNT